MPDTFHFTLVTPERAVLQTDEATFVAFPAHDGEVGVLAHHAPFLYKLGIGLLRVEAKGETHRFFIDGGFAQMVENRLTLLTEEARKPEEIDRATAQKALEEARAMAVRDDASFAARQRAVERARAQLRVRG